MTPAPKGTTVAILGGVALVAAVAALRPRRVVVDGVSMVPALVPGDRLLVVRTGSVHPGDVVAVRDPRDPTRFLVKRVASVCGATVMVQGDNREASIDSRTFGPVRRRDVVGKALRRYAPTGRRGRVS